MEDYVKSALVASYKRPDDERPALDRFREVSKYGHETVIAELFCAASDCLPHVRDAAAEHPSMPTVLVSLGSSTFWLVECLKCFESDWSSVAFEFSGIHGKQKSDEDAGAGGPSEEQRLQYDKTFSALLSTESRHYVVISHSLTGQTLDSFIGMLLAYRERRLGFHNGFEISVVQLRPHAVAEQTTVTDLLCAREEVKDDASLANSCVEGVKWIEVKAATVVGLCGCDLEQLADVIPRGTRFYPPDWWGQDPNEAERSRTSVHDRFKQEDVDHFQRLLRDTNLVGAANSMRLYGNKLFTVEEYEEAATAYINARLYLEKVLALIKGVKGLGELSSAEGVRTCRLSCATNAAACHLKLGKLDECLSTCKDALHIDPTNVKAMFRKAQAELAKGQAEEGEQTLREAQGYAPDDTSIKRELAKLAQQRKKDVQKERERAKKMFG